MVSKQWYQKANCWSKFFINDKSDFSNGARSLPRNSPDFTILYSCVFDNFILAGKLFAKALQRFETCQFVSNIYE